MSIRQNMNHIMDKLANFVETLEHYYKYIDIKIEMFLSIVRLSFSQ